MPQPYQVLRYNLDNLVGLFAGKHAGRTIFPTTAASRKERLEFIASKPQLLYLDDYLKRLGVQTIVYEANYIDRHYAGDFNGYYVHCFSNYEKTCSRLHFFTDVISKKRVEAIIAGSGTARPLDPATYRGFVVVKPLPETVIGRSFLSPPDHFAVPQDGFFLTEKGYQPNLFGMDLVIAALPFQEQDREVGACATTAVWTLFHGTAPHFDNIVPSPLEITQRAYASLPGYSSGFPNDGLNMIQLASVIRNLGLDSIIRGVDHPVQLRAETHAYVRGGVPVILAIDLNYDDANDPERHAVTITGVGAPTGPLILIEDTDLRLRASRVQHLYAHDDGVGPYTMMKLDAGDTTLTTGWKRDSKPRKARPLGLVIPLTGQIRVRFSDVLLAVASYDAHLKKKDAAVGLDRFDALEWDIYLSSPSMIKRDVLAAKDLSAEERERILTAGFPRFVWRVAAYLGGKLCGEFILDATELRQGRHTLESFFYHLPFAAMLRASAAGDQVGRLKHPRIMKSFLRHLQSAPPIPNRRQTTGLRAK